jgi:hypothetical protein
MAATRSRNTRQLRSLSRESADPSAQKSTARSISSAAENKWGVALARQVGAPGPGA